MKRIIFSILLLLTLCAIASAEGIETVIPNDSQWGLSQAEFQKQNTSDFTPCEIGSYHGLVSRDVTICFYNMDCYYLFGEPMNDSRGQFYPGLSKVTYILNDDRFTQADFPDCCQALISAMKDQLGQPDAESKAVTTWNRDRYKVDIGAAKVAKYTGSNDLSVIMVITGRNIPKPTLAPTATPRPTPTPKPTATPKPQYHSLDYVGVSRYPDKYTGKYVKFTGIIVQSQETSFVSYEGRSLFDDYYVLRVASKYEKYKSIDGYDTDDIVYVVVPKDQVEGGRILEDDKVTVYGRYDGIETYTTILGGSVSIPKVEANRVVIN